MGVGNCYRMSNEPPAVLAKAHTSVYLGCRMMPWYVGFTAAPRLLAASQPKRKHMISANWIQRDKLSVADGCPLRNTDASPTAFSPTNIFYETAVTKINFLFILRTNATTNTKKDKICRIKSDNPIFFVFNFPEKRIVKKKYVNKLQKKKLQKPSSFSHFYFQTVLLVFIFISSLKKS